jgi:hypothetical protein
MRLHLEGQANLAALQRDKLLANPRLGFVYELSRAIELAHQNANNIAFRLCNEPLTKPI